MRKTVIAGNWKMNMTPAKTAEFTLKLIILRVNFRDTFLLQKGMTHNEQEHSA